eukprot:9208042-Prorocentrum_lima.AAC.1
MGSSSASGPLPGPCLGLANALPYADHMQSASFPLPPVDEVPLLVNQHLINLRKARCALGPRTGSEGPS